MNDNALKWVEALRSGKYKQGKGFLTTKTPEGDLDCCLGVACKVAIENGIAIELEDYIAKPETADIFPTHVKYNDNGKFLPENVREWLGLKNIFGQIYGDDPHARAIILSLSYLNDQGLSFDGIADLIVFEQDRLFEKEKGQEKSSLELHEENEL